MSESKTYSRRAFAGSLVAGVLAGVWSGAGAASIPIPNRPLFLANDVQANIFFAIDDSGSMDFGTIVAGTSANASFELGLLPAGSDPEANSQDPGAQCLSGQGNDCYFYPSPIVRIGGFSEYVAPTIEMLKRIAQAGPDAGEGDAENSLADYAREARQSLLSVWRIWNHNHNRMWYNPTVRYTPWQGEDENGNPYVNADPANALINPFDASGTDVNLTVKHAAHSGTRWQERIWNNSAFCFGCSTEGFNDGQYPALYTVWNDANDNGVVEVDPNGDGDWSDAETAFWADGMFVDGGGNNIRVPKPIEIKPENAPFAGGPGRTDCADPMSCTYEEEIQNFANWFQYYRTRELVMKRAVADLIVESSERMGLATINNNAGGTPIADMTDQANKEDLLEQLFEIRSAFGTPLRRMLTRVGHYFDKGDGAEPAPATLGFPELPVANSPILPAGDGGECQQNFAVLFTDGFWNDADGDVDLPAGDVNADADGAGPWDGGPHADTHSRTLADVAMYYYERDLAPTLANTVPDIRDDDDVEEVGEDWNEAQHLVTYTVPFGVPGTLTDADVPANHDDAAAPPWPQPRANEETTVDDLRHAAFNSRGEFLSASDPQQLIEQLSAVLTDIGDRLGVASAVAATSQSIQTGTLIFQGLFDTSNWDGKLFAKTIGEGGVIGAEEWEASELIPAAADRNLFTWNGVNEGIELLWANLSAAQQAQVGSENVLNYIRGDRSQEIAQGGTLRTRDSLLGDIIDSTPVSVTSQQSPLPYDNLPGAEGSSYLSFVADKDTRLDMVYVGANDGVLHGFNSDTGIEEFGYVPQVVFPNLATYADPDYVHRYYVDGGLSAADAYISGGWKTVLLGTTGRGGKAVFALNVSDPGAFGPGHVLWEFTHPELGTMTGTPAIARIGNGALGANTKWVAIFGNGYNSASETAKLFIVDLATGTLIKLIDTDNAIVNNGLATPLLVDTDGDFSVEYAYAGDLQGNLWKFDLSGDTTASWTLATFSNAASPAPLYTALDVSGQPQAITSRPAFAINPEGGAVIVFGTGRLISSGDEVNADPAKIDTLYGIRDFNGLQVASVGARALPSGNQPNNILQPQKFVFSGVQQFGDEAVEGNVGVLTENEVDYTTQNGWYLDLVDASGTRRGERVIADSRVLGGLALFTTFEPPARCNLEGSGSALYAINALSGGRTNFTVFDLNLDDKFDTEDSVTLEDEEGNKTGAIVNVIKMGGTVAPVTLIASQDGNIVYGLVSGLDSGTGGAGGEEIGIGDPGVYRLQPPRSTLGRQSWRQLQ